MGRFTSVTGRIFQGIVQQQACLEPDDVAGLSNELPSSKLAWSQTMMWMILGDHYLWSYVHDWQDCPRNRQLQGCPEPDAAADNQTTARPQQSSVHQGQLCAMKESPISSVA